MPVSEGRLLATLLVDAARMQRTVFDRRMRKLGFTRTQWILLRRVDQQPGVSQSVLAEQLEVEKATAGRLIDKLAEYGWLERRQDENDRRVNRIYLTRLGRKIHSKISPIAEAMVRDELSGLSRQERDQLGGLLMRVKKRLQEMAEENEPIESEELERENA
jgi:MarR family transcriptional regulator, transcriptional regulator for hemolysin